MKKYKLNDLERAVRKVRKSVLDNHKRKYALARELGFSSRESQFLASKKEEVIRELAEERRLKRLNEGE